jgi:uncharacterized repeat protein (TIGR01451 family)
VSKGRRLVIATGIALAVAFGVQLVLAQAPSRVQNPSAGPAAESAAQREDPKTQEPTQEPAPAGDPAVKSAVVRANDPFPVTQSHRSEQSQPTSQTAVLVTPPSSALAQQYEEQTGTPGNSEPAGSPTVVAPGAPPTPRYPVEAPAPTVTDDRDAKSQQSSGGATDDPFAKGQTNRTGDSPSPPANPTPTPEVSVPRQRTRDEFVIPAQAPSTDSPPAASGAGAGVAPDAGTEGFVLRPESLPVGPHAVGLTVDVQAPAAVNLNRPTTLLIVIKNSGHTDALGVVVREALPDGLELIDSSPAPSAKSPILVWNLGTLSATSEKRIQLKVKATKKISPIDHAPTVSMLTGGRARMVVREPKLSVEQRPDQVKVLKGHQVRFDIKVTNTGDGPARDVIVQAKLGPGLKHDAGTTIELPLKLVSPSKTALAPGESVDLDLVVDTVAGGEQACEIVALSPDVSPGSLEARAAKTIEVVEPKLVLKVKGPAKRFTGNLAAYHLVLENPGTAVAKSVAAAAVLPLTGGRVTASPNAEWQQSQHRLYWRVGDIEPGKSVDLPFTIQLGPEQTYRIDAIAAGESLKVRQSSSTLVEGMADVKFGVRERKRVIDVGEETIYEVTIRNDGTSEARKLLITAVLSENLKVTAAGGTDKEAQRSQDAHQVKYPEIDRLAAGAEMVLTIQAQAVKPGSATCRVDLIHEDHDGAPLQHTANTRVTASNDQAP